MRAYLDLLANVLDEGDDKTDRTGVGTRSLFGTMMHFDLREGFPLVTTKRVFWKGVVEELLWMIAGETNVRRLQERGVTIWNEWAKPDGPNGEGGDLGPVYGAQWRGWHAAPTHSYGEERYIDQLRQVRDRIKTHPDCRRLIVSAWNVGDIPDMALAPCHCLFQFSVTNGRLSCRLDQRSADMFLGVPFNIASYALLTHMMARDCGLEVGEFIWQGGDTHIYANHFKQVAEQLSREPRPLPTLRFTDDAPTDIFEMRAEHFVLEGYDPHPAISAPVAV